MLWWEWLLCFITAADIVVNVILFIFCVEETEWQIFSEFFNPIKIYKNYKVNYFGCFMLMLVYHAIFLPFAIGYWLYKLGWLFCKLCTIGRK